MKPAVTNVERKDELNRGDCVDVTWVDATKDHVAGFQCAHMLPTTCEIYRLLSCSARDTSCIIKIDSNCVRVPMLIHLEGGFLNQIYQIFLKNSSFKVVTYKKSDSLKYNLCGNLTFPHLVDSLQICLQK